MPPVIHEKFNPVTVELANSNLIEASAGTGKTFSIALLAIRLVIEKNMSIANILMVTFTNAAVAELEVRVRAFVRKTLQLAESGDHELYPEDPLAIIINNAIHHQQISINTLIERLKQAEILLDETAVMTIHGFCQKTLAEFSFETQQLFGSNTITPDELNEILVDYLNEWWRKNITTLKVELLEDLVSNGLNRDYLIAGIKKIIGGQKIYDAENIPFNFLQSSQYLQQETQLNKYHKTIEDCNNSIKNELSEDFEKYKQIIVNKKESSYEYKAYGKAILCNDLDLLVAVIEEKCDTGYTSKIFSENIVTQAKLIVATKNELSAYIQKLMNWCIVVAANYVQQEMIRIKNSRGLLSYDDMINNLYDAVVNNPDNQILKQNLRNKYQAVFIDEFQDTDKHQYGIFNELFGIDHLLFYIGDPKQSIYAFRKADINTYLRASKEVMNVYRMNTNYRSTESYIHSMNRFFKPRPDFDTFYFGSQNNLIDYIKVNAPQSKQPTQLLKNGQPVTPLLISSHEKNNDIYESVVGTIMELLTPDLYTIQKNDQSSSVKLSDIGILVRSNKEARALKKWLSNYNIPAITIDDTKVFDSQEARDILYLLEAVYEITPGNINKALLTQTGGFDKEKLMTSNDEYLLQQFRIYQESWNTKGAFVMLKQFLADRDFSVRLFNENVANAERIISNTFQLIEIIHKAEKLKNYEPKALIQWFKKSIEGITGEGDEFIQRIESDEDAVKIITIHKSKGLEYTIVLAPFLDFNSEGSKHKTIDYRNPQNGDYYYAVKNIATDQEKNWAITQAEQENRRLLYVAITRAKLQCFLFVDVSKKGKSTVQKFLTALGVPTDKDIEQTGDGWEKWITPTINTAFRLQKTDNQRTLNYAVAEKFNLLQPNWKKTSYSSLSPEHAIPAYTKPSEPIQQGYDQFTFRDLKKGAHTGNLLHYIFENIQFNQPQNWPKVIEKALLRLSSNPNPDYAQQIEEMLKEVMHVQIPVNKLLSNNQPFCLNELTRENRLTELEFDFPLRPFSAQQIQALSTSETPFHIKDFDEIEGIMNGKIDLFFKMHNKYYILDWKSNHIGYSVDDYTSEKIAIAMGENNYHLQYHLYTLAAFKYLSHCLPNFDYDNDFGGVIYLFLRGVRQGAETGMILRKPDKKIINQLQNIF